MNATKLCSIADCDKPSRKRGWCDKHYKRWQRHGNPDIKFSFDAPDDSFKARTELKNGCLIWTGGKDQKGYGRITVRKKPVRAHRYAWEQANGPIPKGAQIDHVCYNPSCVKVNHLRMVTPQQNSSNRSGPETINNGSGMRNVYKSGSGWMVRVGKNGKRYYFGTHRDILQAKKIAEKARQQLFGEYAGRG